MNAKNRIMIYGPKPDGTYIVEFRIANGEALAISVPAGETRVLKYFQERMPYELFVPVRSMRNFWGAQIVYQTEQRRRRCSPARTR